MNKPPFNDETRKAHQAFVDETKQKLREALHKVDDHPVGHVVCELMRGHVKGEIRTGEDAVRTAFDACMEQLVPQEFRPPTKPKK